MANNYMKELSTSLVIRKIKVKTTKKYHLTSVGMASIKRIGNYKNPVKIWRRTLVYC